MPAKQMLGRYDAVVNERGRNCKKRNCALLRAIPHSSTTEGVVQMS
jgi:hypothetical protein